MFKLLNYIWIIDLVLSLFKSSKSLFESKDPLKKLAQNIKEMLEDKEITGDDILKVIDIIKASKDLGDLDSIHKALTTNEDKETLINIDQVLKFGKIGLIDK